MFLSVVIASKGRAEVLNETIDSLDAQTRRADEIIVVVTSEQDYNKKIKEISGVTVFLSSPGGSVQRNFGIERTSKDSDLVVFLDDDVELATDYLLRVENFFFCLPNVIAISGVPLLDIPEDGRMSRNDAKKRLSEPKNFKANVSFRDDLYGCNMAVRRSFLNFERFDENLVGYSYLEDVDLGRRLNRRGLICNYGGDSLIHLGVPGGRISQRRLGYAQIMNPLYLFFVKGSLDINRLIYSIVKVPTGNILGAFGVLGLFRKNVELDKARKERVKGNIDVFQYILKNGIDPKSVLNYKK
jgi:glycosyltransferase involved in cell wall biosynthesis